MKPKPKPWDRLPGETNTSYPAFVAYLQMPERSLQKLADFLSKKRQQLDTWANKYDWRGRAAAYDASIVEALRQDLIQRKKKALARKDQLGNLLMDKAEEIIKATSIKRGSFRSAVEMIALGNQLVDESIEQGAQGAEDSQLTINIVPASKNNSAEK